LVVTAYLGWPTALRFSATGHDVGIVDSGIRHRYDAESGTASLVPIAGLTGRGGCSRATTNSAAVRSPAYGVSRFPYDLRTTQAPGTRETSVVILARHYAVDASPQAWVAAVDVARGTTRDVEKRSASADDVPDLSESRSTAELLSDYASALSPSAALSSGEITSR
jgi:hypothetical protein